MILIYSEEISPRLEYISKLIFEDILGVKVSFTSNSAEFLKSSSPKINYSFEKFGDELYLKANKFLFRRALYYPEFNSVWHNGEKYFFETSKDSFLPFDPFAASFFVVTRLEEYLEKRKAKYKRYNSKWSILSKNNLLEKPVVNSWANLIAEKVSKEYPQVEFPAKEFKFYSTIDVDNAWSFKNKGLFRQVGATASHFIRRNHQINKERFGVLFKGEQDPYDTYQYLDEAFKGMEKNVKFFFLLGDFGKYDKNISTKNKNLKALIASISQKYEIGIHPSYASSKKGGSYKIAKEKKRLEEITGKETSMSRQHFLRLRFPKTYNRLIKHRILNDYTMGYPSRVGFRAGICTPFYFYDLKKDKATKLRIHPFQVMDVTLKEYMGLTPAEAKEKIRGLMEEIKKVGGTFIGLWHNETVSDMGRWKGYREVFEYMNQLGMKLENG